MFLERILPLLVKYNITSGPKVRKVHRPDHERGDGYTLELVTTADTVPDEAVIAVADANMRYFFDYADNYHGDPPRTTKLLNYNTVLKRFVPYTFVPYHTTVNGEVREAYEIVKAAPVSAEPLGEVACCHTRLKAAYSNNSRDSKISELMTCNTRLREANSGYVFAPFYCLDANDNQIETYELVQPAPLPDNMMSDTDGAHSSELRLYLPDEYFTEDGARLTFGPLSKEFMI